MPTPRVTIDALPLKGVPDTDDQLVIQDSGITKRVPVSGLLTLVPSGGGGGTGEDGAPGPPGANGTSIRILGTLTGEDTPLPTDPQPGDIWILGDPVPLSAPVGSLPGDGIEWLGGVPSPSEPAAPTSLTAAVAPSAGLGSGQVRLTWVAPANNGGTPITDYIIEQSIDDVLWTLATDSVSTAVTSTLSGLTDDTPYYFRVSARNAVGDGPSTASVTATPNDSVLLTAPLAPLRLTAEVAPTPGVVTGEVLLTWAPPPEVPPVNCALDPGLYGYPDASNTGFDPDTTFTRVPEDATSGVGWVWNTLYLAVFPTVAGTVLEGLDITGSIVIDVPDVVVTNCRVATCGDEGDCIAVRYKESDIGYRGSGAHIIHNTLIGTPPGCTARARSCVRDTYGEATGIYVDGNDCTGSGNFISLEHQAIVVNNYCHVLGHLPGDHHSGISTHGGAISQVWQHNTVLLAGQVFEGGGGISGACTIYSDFAHAQNVTIEDNLLSGGSYIIYGGNSGAAYTTPSTNIKIINNRIVDGSWDNGPIATWDPDASGNEWSGNVRDQDGTTLDPFIPIT